MEYLGHSQIENIGPKSTKSNKEILLEHEMSDAVYYPHIFIFTWW